MQKISADPNVTAPKTALTSRPESTRPPQPPRPRHGATAVNPEREASETKGATCRSKFGTWNIARKTPGGGWELLGTREAMIPIIKLRKKLATQYSPAELYICDAAGELYLVSGPPSQQVLVPDVDMFAEPDAPEEKVVL